MRKLFGVLSSIYTAKDAMPSGTVESSSSAHRRVFVEFNFGYSIQLITNRIFIHGQIFKFSTPLFSRIYHIALDVHCWSVCTEENSTKTLRGAELLNSTLQCSRSNERIGEQTAPAAVYE